MIVVTFFGIGTIRYAPGTVTSLITTVFLFSLFHIIDLSNNFILIFLLLILILSFPAVKMYIEGNENKDPQEVVIDEVIGQSIPIYLYEVSHGTEKIFGESILFYIYIFILFRFFDIKKPYPIKLIEKKFRNNFGVIFDDIISGFYVVFTLIIFMTIKSNFF